MDANTHSFISNLKNHSRQEVLEKLHFLNTKYKLSSINTGLLVNIYNDLDGLFYGGNLHNLINKKRIRFYKISDVDFCLMECQQYHPEDRESRLYDFGLGLNIEAIKQAKNPKFYSGGFTTHSVVEFITLMLLHEIIHLVEFNDSYLKDIEPDHSILFYMIGHKTFKMISQYSTIIQTKDKIVKCPWSYTIRLLNTYRMKDIFQDGMEYLQDYTCKDSQRKNRYIIH